MKLTPHRALPDINNRTFFVGDIHAEYSQLMRQLEHMGFDFSSDRLIAVGDIIDRGPEPLETLRLLTEPWFFSVLGNHELMFLTAMEDPLMAGMHTGNGGEWTYDYPPDVLELLRGLILQQMPVTLSLQAAGASFGVVHACSGEDWQQTTALTDFDAQSDLMWDFGPASDALNGVKSAHVAGVDRVISGHLTNDALYTGGNQIWIDTFAQSGRFTILSAEQALGL